MLIFVDIQYELNFQFFRLSSINTPHIDVKQRLWFFNRRMVTTMHLMLHQKIEINPIKLCLSGCLCVTNEKITT
jgi:hypothetical protein